MGNVRAAGNAPMSDKHVHQPDFRCCLWSVDRSTNNITRGRGTRLRYHRILRQGPRSVLLARDTPGRRLFLRTQLGDRWSLYETPSEAITGFRNRAEHWRDCALNDVAWAERDIAFAELRPLESILRHAREGS